jgi:hypothetical protein
MVSLLFFPPPVTNLLQLYTVIFVKQFSLKEIQTIILIHLPMQIALQVPFIPLYRSIFPFGIIFLLAENFGSAFLAVLDS